MPYKPPDFVQVQDDQPLVVSRGDFSAGENTRLHASKIIEQQGETIENFDIGIPGTTTKVKGLTLIQSLSTDPGLALFGYMPDGGTAQLVAMHGTTLTTWNGSGTFTTRKTDFTNNTPATIIKIGEQGEGEVFVVGNGVDPWWRFEPDDLGTPQTLGTTAGTGSDSPPKSTVGTYFNNRFWVLKDLLTITKGNLFFSAAYSDNYATAFDTLADAFRIPCGTERALIGLRGVGLIVVGADQVWGLNPSVVPDPATDKPEKILDIGCVAGNTAVQVGDDIWFMAADGIRGIFRTQQDKLQIGQSFPLSYLLKSRFDNINWAQISKACAIYWDNKYFVSLPTGSSTYNNEVWVFYPSQLVNVGNNINVPATMVISGWNVSKFAKMKVGGEERLYAIDSSTGKVYRAWYGYDNNSTAITATLAGREEDFGSPLQFKIGGTLEIEAEVAGSGNTFSVNVALNGGNFQALGAVNLTSATAPVLPISLPFSLSDSYKVRQKFHLDSLGHYKTIQVQIVNSDLNTDPIIFYGYNIVTYLEEFQDE